MLVSHVFSHKSVPYHFHINVCFFKKKSQIMELYLKVVFFQAVHILYAIYSMHFMHNLVRVFLKAKICTTKFGEVSGLRE